MSVATNIEWTDVTWNPVVGCTRVSAGCDHCYAAAMSRRLGAMGKADYAGLTHNGHFNGVVRCLEDRLQDPLHWRKPRRVFVNSMSDLFHPDVPFEFIDKVFAVAALCPQHKFQFLTKRPERMAEYLCRDSPTAWTRIISASDAILRMTGVNDAMAWGRWPIPNTWLGASCEDQASADERIPHLLGCRAAVLFLSCEPLLGPIIIPDEFLLPDFAADDPRHTGRWIIVGGESGPKARPCDIDSMRSIVQQGRDAGVPVFVKQLGANAIWRPVGPDSSMDVPLDHPKGGNPSEWPSDLQVREYPQ